ncbi:MAG TPA: hypothetical protein VLE73_00680 [Candidatus Saccharimonadales bacterium]|nr:hypothetical protein [Candidatus Saccharimonadales bacterium]
MTKASIVGVWRVKTPDAPFTYHMFTFHSDGTLMQSNPPAGNTSTSDTAGMGIWRTGKDDTVQARFEEYRLGFTDKTVTRGVVDFSLRLNGDTLSGSAMFTIYDAESGEQLRGPLTTVVTGSRVTFVGYTSASMNE